MEINFGALKNKMSAPAYNEFIASFNAQQPTQESEKAGSNDNTLNEEIINNIDEQIDTSNIGYETLVAAQNTIPWYIARNQCIGASEIPALLSFGYEHNNLNTILIKKILNIEVIPKKNIASMSLGHSAEERMRPFFERDMGGKFPKITFINKNIGAIASIDGYNNEHKRILEVKACNLPLYNKIESSKVLPVHFYLQIQAQLLAVGCDDAVCLCVKTVMGGYKTALKIHIKRDEECIKKIKLLIIKTISFIRSMKNDNVTEDSLSKILFNNTGSIKELRDLIKDIDITSLAYVSNSMIFVPNNNNKSQEIFNKSREERANLLINLKNQSRGLYSQASDVVEEADLYQSSLLEDCQYFLGDNKNISSYREVSSTHSLERVPRKTLDYYKMGDTIKNLSEKLGVPYNEEEFKRVTHTYKITETRMLKNRENFTNKNWNN